MDVIKSRYTFGIFAIMNSLDTATKNLIALSTTAVLVPIIIGCVIFPVSELAEDEEISSVANDK